jgi:cell wall-associated NlpC family hydrolase
MSGEPLEAVPEAARLVAAARGYVGAPWRHLGRSGRLGVDCIGLVLAAAADAGLPAEFTAEPPAYAKGHRGPEFLAALRARCPRIPLELAAPGDVLAFADGQFAAHVGMRSERHGVPHVIHAHARRRVVVEEPLAHDLARSLRAAFRVPAAAWRVEG